MIIDLIFKHWIALFGTLNRFLSDNGGEFNDELYKEMAELLNIEVLSTAGESLWSNGITERHNAIISNMLERILEENKCSMEVALAWAVSAKNSLQNVYGYSPNQLVFGKNPSFPTVLNNDPPSLESSTASEVVAEHLNALHAARKAYITSESCEKLRRAMKHRVRPATSLVYQTGDVVFYKRNESSKWKGPGIVIGRDNHQVFVKHSGTYVRVNPCHLRPSTDTGLEKSNVESQMMNYKQQSNSDLITVNYELKDGQDGSDLSVNEHPSVGDPDIQQHPEQHEVSSNDNEISKENESDRSTLLPSDGQTHELEAEYINPTLTAGRLPTTGNKIEYKLPNSRIWHAALVLGRADKATGKNKYWINIKNLSDNTLHCLNLIKLTSWKIWMKRFC